MPDPSSWESFAAVGGVVVFLGALTFALQRLGILRRAAPPSVLPPDRLTDLETRVCVLEERTLQQRESIERLGRLHSRIDQIDQTTSHTDGQIVEMGRNLRLVLEHLMGTGQ